MQHIDSDLIRGNIDTIILKTMLNEDKYGLDIIKEVSEKSSGTYELKQPTLYSCLKRLENQELISSYWVDSDIGGRRHYYKLTDKGREFYDKKQEEWAKSKFIIDNLLSNYDYEEYRLVKKDEFDEIIQQKANSPLSNFSSTIASEEISNASNSEESEPIEELAEDLTEPETKLIEELEPEQEPISEIAEYQQPKMPEKFKVEIDEDDDEEYGTYYRNKDSDYRDEDYDTYKKIKPEYSDESAEEDDDDDESIDDISFDDEPATDESIEALSENDFDESLEEYESYLEDEFEEEPTDEEVLDLGGENETDEFVDETYSEEESDADNSDYPVYFSATPTESKIENATVSYETSDQTSNELNILSRLRGQEDEEINTYYGDQKSYVNHLNQLDESKLEQQDLLDSSLYVKPDLVNKSINDFAEAVDKLNSFNSESIEFENEKQNHFEDEESEEITENKDLPDYSDDENYDDLEELEKLKNISSHAFFYSEDKTNYNETTKKQESSIDSLTKSYDLNEFEDGFEQETYDFEETKSQSFAEISSEIEPRHNEDYSFETTKDNEYKIDTDDSDDFLETDYNCENSFSDIDSIITNNITTTYPEASQHFFKSQTNVNYREKLSDLSKYSKVTLDEDKSEINNSEAIEKAKDIAEITKELEEEGIRIKEHYKTTNLKGLDKNYLLSNKISFMKSLIMFFGYVFILSALYIVLNNTNMKNMEWFSITPFLIGFIPFAVILIYRGVLFAINPYKKVDAKYHSRIMLFISIIITIQLLLITYCVNLQLGFYSFAQKQYNHLFWIIPTIISFAPIIDNLVYLALFKSKNFNV